jgi:hypothetical protein
LRINDAIERYQTAEERIERYELLLRPEHRTALGPAVTSRLCADYAMLLDRCGDGDGFARWLTEAVAVDPSNRSAAATAAGFFRARVEDPVNEAEWLTTLVLADPTAPEAVVMLAELLLEHGAYAGADRLYGLAARSQVLQLTLPEEGMLADWAVAQWGAGDADGALETIQEQQRRSDELFRHRLRQEDPQLTQLELARRHGPLLSTLATVRAAIHERLADVRASSTLDAALGAYELEIAELEAAADSDPASRARHHLRAAWVALWLGAEIEDAARHLDAATALLGDDGLSPEAEARFEGWVALRRRDPDRAVALLEPVSERDDAARLGLALARREMGELRDAARHLYAVYSSRPGSLMAVWASDVLAEVLGQRPRPGPIAGRLEELIASIPSVVDRFPDEPTLAVSLRLSPTKLTFMAYEPIIINVEIANNSPLPLAIDSEGPIRSQIALLCSVQIARVPGLPKFRPIILDIDRRLRLGPRERLIVPVDVHRTELARALTATPLRGATMTVKAVIAFRMTSEDVLGPGLLGSEASSPPIRVDGVRMTRPWITDAIAAVVRPDSAQDLTTIALLSHVAPLIEEIRAKDERQRSPGEKLLADPQLAEDATSAVVEAYPKENAAARAWLLSVMPRGAPALAPVYTMAQKDEDRHVRLMYLLNCLTGPDDPMIDAARRGSDPDIRAVAEIMHDRILAARAAP